MPSFYIRKCISQIINAVHSTASEWYNSILLPYYHNVLIVVSLACLFNLDVGPTYNFNRSIWVFCLVLENKLPAEKLSCRACFFCKGPCRYNKHVVMHCLERLRPWTLKHDVNSAVESRPIINLQFLFRGHIYRPSSSMLTPISHKLMKY